MQKRYFLPLFLLLTTTIATAQYKPPTEKERAVEYGYIPEQDLKMTVYPLDSSAEAVVLARKLSKKLIW